MEDKLKQLITAGDGDKRTEWALDQQRHGKKVIGVLCSYVPEEVIYAAGMLSWQVNGTLRTGTPLADAYFPVQVCAYITHIMESLLQGELDFLDGVVSTDWDDDRRHMLDLWIHLKKGPFVDLIRFPAKTSKASYEWVTGEIRRLADALSQQAGIAITDDALWNAIEVYNTTRSLFARVYELRKREVPPLSGEEVHGIAAAATVMPREVFNQELESLLPYLEERKTSVKNVRPRVLVSSDVLHDSGYLRIIEETGALVAMDDLDRGSRYFWQKVDTSIEDPALALAKRYLDRPACPRMTSWEGQAQQVIEWVKEYQIQGVVELCLMYSRPREMRIPFFKKALKEANIPLLNLRIDYPLNFVGQFQTRVGAFMEMLD